MSARTQIFIGLSLLVIGLIKTVDHSMAAGMLTIPTCFGGEITMSVDVPLWHRVHCWGCYVAAFGLAVLAHALVWRVQIGSQSTSAS